MMTCRTTTKTITNGFIFPTTNSILSSRTTSLPFSTITRTTTTGIERYSKNAAFQSKNLQQQLNNDDTNEIPLNPSSTFALDPQSEEAHQLLNSLGITDSHQQEQLQKLSHLVVEWNGRLNLISRKDCTAEVVFGRHILPAISLSALPDFLPPSSTSGADDADGSPSLTNFRVVDVGTGGGFPQFPLAIIYPYAQFLLVDSVGKKLKAVEEMVNDLGLTNVKTYHGRVEEMVDNPVTGMSHKGAYDICVGRSVTALPRFCFWIQDLLKKGGENDGEEEGKLVYIIGGEVEPMVLSRVRSDSPIDALIGKEGVSDKRILVVDRTDILAIASKSGETKSKRGVGKSKNNPKKSSGREKAKGSWVKRDSNIKKERGYDNFKRY